MSRERSTGGVVPVEPGPSQPVSEIEVLAAVARAELHHENGPNELRAHPNFRDLALQLGWEYGSHSTRRIRPLLTGLAEAGLLRCEASDRHRPASWEWIITDRGRRRLEGAGSVSLPESPRHRRWRHAQESARKALDGGLREEARTAVLAAGELLEDDGPGGALRDFDRRRAVAKRIQESADALATALHTLDEWPEPIEDSA